MRCADPILNLFTLQALELRLYLEVIGRLAELDGEQVKRDGSVRCWVLEQFQHHLVRPYFPQPPQRSCIDFWR